jgi:hypothetical protein
VYHTAPHVHEAELKAEDAPSGQSVHVSDVAAEPVVQKLARQVQVVLLLPRVESEP